MSQLQDARELIGCKVKVCVDRPLGSRHPKHPEIEFELNSGYAPDTLAADGEDFDAYIIGIDEPLGMFRGLCVAVIIRSNDVERELVVVPEGLGLR